MRVPRVSDRSRPFAGGGAPRDGLLPECARSRPGTHPRIRTRGTSSMKYTHLGSTGVSVSRICLGCMSYGSSTWRPWILDAEASRPFFRQAVEAGINFFDTANVYSGGASEEVTGRWLKEYANRDEIVIATK